MLISQNRKQLVLNSALELGEDLTVEKKGKGRKFVSRFIEAGVAHYQEFGDILITKETLDKFIHTMVGCPLIINHKEITDKNADKERVGVISNVWFNDMDGWYYCDGIIWDLQAIDLVKNQGWSVSCTYDFVSDNLEKTHNGKKIDLEFIDGNFLHLALVENPRYERANIVINSKDKVENWDESKHPRDEKGQFAKVFEEVGKKYETNKETKEKKEETNVKKDIGIDTAKMAFEEQQEKRLNEIINKELPEARDDLSKLQTELRRKKEKNELTQKERQEYNIKQNKLEYKIENLKKEAEILRYAREKKIDKKNEENKEKIETKQKNLDINWEEWLKKKAIEKYNKAQNGKDLTIMTVLKDLEKFIKGIVDNACDKEEKVENEDKRKIIDEVGGILKDKVDEEVWRTVIGKLEKIAYNPSETDKADNKCKNEDDEEKEEKEEKFEEEKEIAENKKAKNEDKEDKEEDKKEDKTDNKCAKNSMEDITGAIMGGNVKTKTVSSYVSQSDRLKAGENY